MRFSMGQCTKNVRRFGLINGFDEIPSVPSVRNKVEAQNAAIETMLTEHVQ